MTKGRGGGREVKWMEREYVCSNGIRERVRFMVGDTAKPRKKKTAKTSDWKQLQNDNAAMRQVARLLNCNAAKTKKSLLLTLTYDDRSIAKLVDKIPEELRDVTRAAMSADGAIGAWSVVKRRGKTTGERPMGPAGLEEGLYLLRKAGNDAVTAWMRKLKRKAEKQLECLIVTSDMDGETKETVRLHHHIVVMEPGELTVEQISEAWKFGDVDHQSIRAQKDMTPIAVYLMQQARRVKSEAKYRCTRGLARPIIQDREITGRAEMRIPAGAQVMEHPEYHEGDVVQYARYYWPKHTRAVKRDGELKGEGEDYGIPGTGDK